MKTKVTQRLGITPEAYENAVFDMYIQWCAAKTSTEKSLQKVLVCMPLFHWWQRELTKLEERFLEDTEPYKDALTTAEAHQVYHSHTIAIHNRFSKPLIKKAYDS